MVQTKSLRPLAVTFFASGIWDLFATFFYAFLIGTVFIDPPVHRFSALFIASFLLCFAYLQILSAFIMRQYLLIIGGVIIGRVIYAILLCVFIFYVPGFSATFWWTGVIDIFWSVLYIVLAVRCGIRVRDLFLPHRVKN
jgi:hypothetical protein